MIIFLKLITFLKRLAAAFFVNLIWKPVRLVLKFLFYKVIIKLYGLYLNLIKKLGWNKGGRKALPWLISHKLVHFIVIFLTVAVTGFNFSAGSTQAISPQENAGNTFLSELVSSEFGENDQLIEEYFDEEADISPAQQTYLDNLSTARSQDMAGLDQNDSENPDYNQGGAIIKPNIAATEKTMRQREGIVSYTVQTGDTISTIAADFGVSANTILWENNLTAYSLIRPGDELLVLPVSGVTYKVAKNDTLSKISGLYNIEESKISEINKLSSDMVAVGQKLIIPGGRKMYAESAPKALPKSYTGISAVKDLISPLSAKPVSGNKMNWPTQGYRITQYYSWGHHAVDIANKTGTPIYACDSGTIEYAGWGTGYGNQIVIDHGGGKMTRYAHLSKIYYAKGDEVSKGQVIAAMGSTGRSTGPHLHFELIINGVKYNPLNYVK